MNSWRGSSGLLSESNVSVCGNAGRCVTSESHLEMLIAGGGGCYSEVKSKAICRLNEAKERISGLEDKISRNYTN